jgi:hypothetical protein
MFRQGHRECKKIVPRGLVSGARRRRWTRARNATPQESGSTRSETRSGRGLGPKTKQPATRKSPRMGGAGPRRPLLRRQIPALAHRLSFRTRVSTQPSHPATIGEPASLAVKAVVFAATTAATVQANPTNCKLSYRHPSWGGETGYGPLYSLTKWCQRV